MDYRDISILRRVAMLHNGKNVFCQYNSSHGDGVRVMYLIENHRRQTDLGEKDIKNVYA